MRGRPVAPAGAALRLLAALAALAAAAPGQAADAPPVPSAGTVLRDLQPPAALAPPRPPADTVLPAAPAAPASAASAGNGERFTLRRIRLSGHTVFSDAQLQPLLADALDQPVDLAGLQALAQRLTRHYRQAGYLVAQALLPAQDIVDGTVQISVVEGRFGAVTLKDGAGLRTPALPLAGLAAGDVIAEAPLERALLLLNDLPGVRASATLQPGASVGTSALVVELQPRERLVASADADNHGSRSTGVQRLGGTLALNNPLGLGDVATLRVQAGAGGLLKYARLGWQLPVNRWGSRLGAAVSDMRYRLGGDFAALQATGRARITSLFGSHPVLRSRSTNLSLQLLVDDKQLRDRIGSTDSVADKAVQVLALGATGDMADAWGGGGNTAWSATWSSGRLRLRSPEAQAQDDASARTAGHFDKLVLSLQRQQWLGDWGGQPVSLQLQAIGQWAPKNLDPSEKLPLGGEGGVRAFASGDAPVDQGQLLSLELRRALAPGWQATLFTDLGHGRSNARGWTEAGGSATRRLAGAGLGLSWSPLPALSLHLQYAQRLGQPGTAAGTGQGRWWGRVQWALAPA